jgi:hypothetical protein
MPQLAARAPTVRIVGAARTLHMGSPARRSTMKSIIVASILSMTIFGCSKKNDCEQIVDHTVSLMPPEWKAQVEQSKAEAIGKCEKMSPEAKKCALDAQSLADLMKCPKS